MNNGKTRLRNCLFIAVPNFEKLFLCIKNDIKSLNTNHSQQSGMLENKSSQNFPELVLFCENYNSSEATD